MSERPILAYAVVLVVTALLGVMWLRARDEEAPAASPPVRFGTEAGADGGGSKVVVHVAGAVRAPGVYRLRSGSRVDDAVRRAGGPTRRADLSAVNLAAEVEDGRQVLVPLRLRAAGGRAGAVGAAVASGPLNLNTATLEQLDQLDGIGPGLAQRILDHRERVGGFGSVEELADVPGIGEVRMAALRELVTV